MGQGGEASGDGEGENSQLNQAEDICTEVTGDHAVFKLSIQEG